MNITDKFVDDLYNLSKKDFPDRIVSQAKRCLLDYLGVTFAGAQMLQEKGNNLLDYLGETQDGVSVIGFNRKAGIENASFINGLSSHVAELDDGVRFGGIHPGAPIISALLPFAEKEHLTGSDLLLGIIIGYEAGVRLANSMYTAHYINGFHPTSTCGSIGAALGLAAMLNFTKTQMKDTLSSAVVSASGSLKVLENGSELKPYNVARASLISIYSALMARVGFKGPDDALTGDAGFYSMMAKKCDSSRLERGSCESSGIEKVYVKPYASCRHSHAAIEAALRIKSNKEFSVGNIRVITVTTYQGVIGKHDHTDVCGVSSAKMSIPYSVAIALLTGKAGIDEFSDRNIKDPMIHSITKKIVVCPDEQITALVPQKRSAIVEVLTNDGHSFKERIDFPKGEPENPLSDEELEEKFISLATYRGKPVQDINEIIRIVRNIEEELPQLYQYL